jgi:hypothetical protein
MGASGDEAECNSIGSYNFSEAFPARVGLALSRTHVRVSRAET